MDSKGHNGLAHFFSTPPQKGFRPCPTLPTHLLPPSSRWPSGQGRQGQLYSLPALAKQFPNVARLPVSLRIVLEAVLRHCDGAKVLPEHVAQLANWQPQAERTEEIPFVVARVVLQDFTGVPLLVDLAAMRAAAQQLGKAPQAVEPLVPVDLVVGSLDHGGPLRHPAGAGADVQLEFQRNHERYQFMKWGMQAFDTFGVVPPGFGIVHQVNLEYLAPGIHQTKDGICYPDSLVGTDSHTTMINGIGVVGWGVGGIEAEAAMLGQPVYILTPDVVGFELTGQLREGVTATDLVLTITERLRQEKVVGQFVEFFGAGTASLSVPDRATIGNMSPEYGATMGFFPVDDKTLDYFRGTGRSAQAIADFEAYFRAQGLFGVPQAGELNYSRVVTLDLSTVHPSVAGPNARKTALRWRTWPANSTSSLAPRWPTTALTCPQHGWASALPLNAAQAAQQTTAPAPTWVPRARWSKWTATALPSAAPTARSTSRRCAKSTALRPPARALAMAMCSLPPSPAAPTPATPACCWPPDCWRKRRWRRA